MKTLTVLVGAGGFGKEVMPLMKLINRHAIYVDENPRYAMISGIDVWPLSRLDEEMRNGRRVRYALAIGDGRARRKLASWFFDRHGEPIAVVSPLANVQPYATMGKGAVLCPFVTLNANAEIGDFFQANIYSYVAHDCQIGDYVTLAPGAKINGGCTLDNHVYVGTGAVLLPGTLVGAGAVIGAGAIVTREVRAGATVVGNPARELER